MGAFEAGALLASFEAGTWVDVLHGSSAGALSPGKVSGASRRCARRPGPTSASLPRNR
jgi:hypothetical protein